MNLPEAVEGFDKDGKERVQYWSREKVAPPKGGGMDSQPSKSALKGRQFTTTVGENMERGKKNASH